MRTIVGVDGCRAGWIVASAEKGLGVVQVEFVATIDQVLSQATPNVTTIAIDIPIGLSDCESRECDRCARRFLPVPKKSCVFPAPVRSVLNASCYDHAVQLSLAACNKKLSHQAFGIVPKIREVDERLRITPEMQSWIREAHPEVTFALISGHPTVPLASKKTLLGQAQRLEVLRTEMSLEKLLPLKATRDGLRRWARSSGIQEDDVVDALGCLMTANRIHRGVARVYCSDLVQLDHFGLRMEIVA